METCWSGIWGCAVRKINDRDNATATRISKNKTIDLMSKTTTFHVEHSFLHNYGVKLPNFMFYGEREQAMTKFFYSFWTWILPLIQLSEGSPTFYKVSG